MASHVPTSGAKPIDFHPYRKRSTRKISFKVPCDECIQNASRGTNRSSNQLCEACIGRLRQPRRRQQQAANIGKIRCRSNTVIDTAQRLHTNPFPVPWSEDRQVQRSLRFFIRHSAPQLAGYFDSLFWQQMLLETGFQLPAVKHASAAIGALHERLLLGPDDNNSSDSRSCGFALEQCNHSIRHLMKPTAGEQPDLRSLLTTCILFACFEAMQGHPEQAVTHAKQGCALFSQHASDPENRSSEMGAFAVELNHLCLMMQRLQTQSKGLSARNHHTVGEDIGIGNAPQPVYFETLQDARITLERVTNQFSIFFLDLDLDDNFYEMVRDGPQKCVSQIAWLEAWEQAFSQLLARKNARITASERRGAMVLKAHHLVCEILSNVDLSEGAHGWDRFHRSFRAIVHLAQSVLGTSSRPVTGYSKDLTGTPKTNLCFSLGILDPLYEVCARCRDPLLRRQALDLVANHPRQECLWESWPAWKVGRYLLQPEEGRIDSPPTIDDDAVPDRIAGVPFNFNTLPVSEDEDAGHLKHRHMDPHHPREALNPGLFAGRGIQGKPITNAEPFAGPCSAPLLFD